MFRKNKDTFVIGLIFVILAVVLEKVHFWKAIGLAAPHFFIFQGVMFLVLVAILHHALFDPYMAIAEERHMQTTEKKKQAEAKKIQAQEILKKYEQGILSARLEAIKQKERMGIEAENEEKSKLDEAKQKSQAQLDTAMGEIKLEVEKTRSELTRSTSTLVQQLVEEILSGSGKKAGSNPSKTTETSL